MTSPVSFLGLKKRTLVLLGAKETILPSIGASEVRLRGKLKFNNQLLPRSIIQLSQSTLL